MKFVVGFIAVLLWLTLMDYVCRSMVPPFIWLIVAFGGSYIIIEKVAGL